jgi:hypothetical protein
VDPRAGVEDVEKRKFLTLPGLEVRPPPVVEPLSSRCTDCATQVPMAYDDITLISSFVKIDLLFPNLETYHFHIRRRKHTNVKIHTVI